MNHIAEEKLTYGKDGVAIYTVQIKDFHRKMRLWPTNKEIRTENFKVQAVDMYLSIFPNGDEKYGDQECKGHVSVYLNNGSSLPVFVDFKLKIGDQDDVESGKCHIEPEDGHGKRKLCNHVSVYPNYKSDKDLEIVCTILKITTDKVVWDLFYETKAIQNDLKAKLASMETKLEELQNDNNNKMRKPPCPICYEEMSYNTKIAQCISGHLLCWGCKEKLEKKECPSCGLTVNGRAFGMESYLRSIFGLD